MRVVIDDCSATRGIIDAHIGSRIGTIRDTSLSSSASSTLLTRSAGEEVFIKYDDIDASSISVSMEISIISVAIISSS